MSVRCRCEVYCNPSVVSVLFIHLKPKRSAELHVGRCEVWLRIMTHWPETSPSPPPARSPYILGQARVPHEGTNVDALLLLRHKGAKGEAGRTMAISSALAKPWALRSTALWRSSVAALSLPMPYLLLMR